MGRNNDTFASLTNQYVCSDFLVLITIDGGSGNASMSVCCSSKVLSSISTNCALMRVMLHGEQKGIGVVEAECDFIKYCRDNAAVLSEHDWYAMISNLSVFEGGDRNPADA